MTPGHIIIIVTSLGRRLGYASLMAHCAVLYSGLTVATERYLLQSLIGLQWAELRGDLDMRFADDFKPGSGLTSTPLTTLRQVGAGAKIPCYRATIHSLGLTTFSSGYSYSPVAEFVGWKHDDGERERFTCCCRTGTGPERRSTWKTGQYCQNAARQQATHLSPQEQVELPQAWFLGISVCKASSASTSSTVRSRTENARSTC